MLRFVIPFLVPLSAFACECAFAPVCERMREAPIVFWGETVEGGLGPEEDAWSGRPKSAKVQVLEAFRGIPEDQEHVEIALSFWKGMCARMPYRIGARTLVFSYTSEEGQLREGVCTASFFAEEGDRELDLVRRYFAGESTKVVGTVREDAAPYVAVDGATVFVAGKDHKRHAVKTSADGSFGVVGLPPGRYRVWATQSGYKRNRKSIASFVLQESGCAITDLFLSSDTR